MAMERNPYAPPTAPVYSVEQPSSTLEIASRRRRLANTTIDSICFFAFVILIGVILSLLGLESLLEAIPESGGMDQVVGLLLFALYYISFEGLTGRTPGKFLTGTRTVNESGGPPTLPQIIGRTAARLIPFEAISFLSRSRIGWHDRLSKTRVIRVR
jgi:uncharacterized RDD family membrane protein YckC